MGNESFNLIDKIDQQYNILGKTKKDRIVFDKQYKFYLRDAFKRPHVLAIKQIDSDSYIKEIYSCKGLKLDSVVDKTVSDKLIYRNIRDKN